MKTKTILFLFLLIPGMMSAQVKRVAILETVDKENKVSYANKLILRANLSKAITNTAGYEAYDRTDIDAIMGEQNFQRTGLVSNDQIKRLGEMTGANYILVAEAVVVDAKNMFITAKLLDVETARTILTDNLMMGTNTDDIQAGCITLAKRLFHEETKKESINKQNSIVLNNTSLPLKLTVEEQQYLCSGELSRLKTTYILRDILKKTPKNQEYKDMKKYNQLITSGWSLMGIGVAGVFIGAYCYTSAPVADVFSITYMGLGAAASIASIPLLTIGYKKRNELVDSVLSLDLTADQNGVGIALNF